MEAGVYALQYRVEKEHWWFRARMMILLRFLARTIAKPPKVRILDVGCGTGAVLESLSVWYECTGIDPSEAAIEFCRRRGLNNLLCGDITSYSGEGGFDVVTFLDVLEHIEDDRGALARASALLAYDGCVLITVPAYQFLWGPQDELLHHKRRYTKRTLKAVVEEAGFSPVYLSYFNTVLFPVALIRRLTARVWPGNPLRDLEIPGEPVNRILKMIFSVERYVIPPWQIPFGLSLLCWARKKPAG